MCGIVGFCGKNKSIKNIVKILKNLEYRGYDSSGVTFFDGENLKTIKAVGNISKLENKIDDEIQTTCAIAHTRWATHGKPNEQNAHPHSSVNGVWSLVHNGIIENFDELKEGLLHKPKSETDTAVIPCLLEEKNAQTIQGFIGVCERLKGSYALVAMRSDMKNTLFIAKNKSPLYVSQNNNGEILIASDPICFAGFSGSYYSLDNHEFALIQNNEIKFFDALKNVIYKQTKAIDNLIESANINNYPHFMLKEIFEQSEALNRLVETYKRTKVLEIFDEEFVFKFKHIKLVGCGTAYHASMMGAKFLAKQTGLDVTFEMASEFIYEQPVFADEQSLFIFVSQSGETADTLQALEIAKKCGSKTIALTNVLHSTLASKCDYILPVCAGPEIAVASTKAYTSQVTLLAILRNLYGRNIRNRE